jgi:hypothetical protein
VPHPPSPASLPAPDCACIMPLIASRTASMPSFGQQDQLRCCHLRLSSASNGFDSSNEGIGGTSMSQANGFAPVQRDADAQASGVTITTLPRGTNVQHAARPCD